MINDEELDCFLVKANQKIILIKTKVKWAKFF
jgi:hypothetical protein